MNNKQAIIEELKRREVSPGIDKAAIMAELESRKGSSLSDNLKKAGEWYIDKFKAFAGPEAIEQRLQAIPFSDEALSAIQSLPSVLRGKKFSEVYAKKQAENQARIEKQQEEHPYFSAMNQIGGALLGAKGLGSTKIGGKIADTLRSGLLPNATSRTGKFANTATKVLQGGAYGAASGGTYGAGAARPGERREGFDRGATVGSVSGAAYPAIAAGASKLNHVFGKKPIIPNSDQIRKKASEQYAIASQKGGILKSELTDDFLGEAQKELLSGDEVIDAMRSSKPLRDTLEDISLLKGQTMTLDRAQKLDEQLGLMVDGFVDKRTGIVDSVGRKILQVQSLLRDMVEGVDESLVQGGKEGFDALKEGRKLWSSSRKMADIERIIQRASNMEHPATGIKAGFRTLLSNPSRMRGFTEAERKAIEKAANSGLFQDVVRLFGSRLLPIGTAVSGGGLGATTAAVAGSTASRELASRAQIARAKQIANIIANRGKVPEKIPFTKTPKGAGLLGINTTSKLLNQ
jgi:hypothetical protein